MYTAVSWLMKNNHWQFHLSEITVATHVRGRKPTVVWQTFAKRGIARAPKGRGIPRWVTRARRTHGAQFIAKWQVGNRWMTAKGQSTGQLTDIWITWDDRWRTTNGLITDMQIAHITGESSYWWVKDTIWQAMMDQYITYAPHINHGYETGHCLIHSRYMSSCITDTANHNQRTTFRVGGLASNTSSARHNFCTRRIVLLPWFPSSPPSSSTSWVFFPKS